MVEDALFAMAAAEMAGAELDLEDVATCQRVRRRFTVHGHPSDIRVVEDYAHHPTEVSATISAACEAGGAVHVLFQPHRWSRTADCFADFLICFGLAKSVAILPVYAAGEEPIPGVGGRDLAEAVATRHADAALVQYVPTTQAGIDWLVAQAQPNDTCLILGAGDVGLCAADLVEALTWV